MPKKAADGSWERTELSSNDKLRKQLLGRNWEKMSTQIPVGKQTGRPNPTKPLPQEIRNKNTEDTSGDDEEGRSSLGKNKRKRTVQDQQSLDETSESKESTSAMTPKRTGAKKTGSYLDEVLSQRKKKKKNKT